MTSFTIHARHIGYFLVAFALLAGPFGCDSSGDSVETSEASSEVASAEGEAAPTERSAPSHEQTARALGERLRTQTLGRGRVDWSTLRRLDGFIAGAPIAQSALLTKIRASKALTRALWETAGRSSGGDVLGAEDLEAVFSPEEAAEWSDRPERLSKIASDLGMKNFHDYRKTGDPWRLVLSVVQDELQAKSSNLPRLTPEARKLLVEQTTHLTVRLLSHAGEAAAEAKARRVRHKHIQQAFRAMREQTGLDNKQKPAPPSDETAVPPSLKSMTGRYITNNLEVIHQRNNIDSSIATLRQTTDLELSASGAQILTRSLGMMLKMMMAQYGTRQMRGKMRNAGARNGRKGGPNDGELKYVRLAKMLNAVNQYRGYTLEFNGDVRTALQSSASSRDFPELRPGELRVTQYDLTAVRDTGIQWMLLKQLHGRENFAADPHALEFSAETIAVSLAIYLEKLEEMKKEGAWDGGGSAEDKRRVRAMVGMMMKKPDGGGGSAHWGEKRRKQKAELLAKYPSQLYRNVTTQAGFPESLGIPERTPQGFGHRFGLTIAVGAGIGVGDVNGDGWPDVYVGGAGKGRLYVNRGKKAPGRFVDRTEEWGLPTDVDDSTMALFFDLEGDGDDDLLILRRDHLSLLMENQGDEMENVASDRDFYTHDGAQVAVVFDYDGDEDLDIYVGYTGRDAVNRLNQDVGQLPSADGRNGSPNQLWRQEEDGEFTLVEDTPLADEGWALAAQAFDYNNDGRVDVILANDFGPNRLWENKGDGKFEDVTKQTRSADRGNGMNVSASDVNGDGWWDFFLTNIDMMGGSSKIVFPEDETIMDIDDAVHHSYRYLTGNKLYINHPNPSGEGRIFRGEEHKRFEPGDQGWGWDGNFLDYENDGDQDLYVSNGWLPDSYAEAQRNLMYLNEEGIFFQGPQGSAENYPGNSRGVAAFDADRDGDLDLLSNNFRMPPRMMENVQRTGNHWLQIRLADDGPNTRAIGSRIVVETGSGEDATRQMRVVTCGRGYISQDGIVTHVGIGEYEEATVRVRWPDGETQVFEGLAADRRHVLERTPTK